MDINFVTMNISLDSKIPSQERCNNLEKIRMLSENFVAELLKINGEEDYEGIFFTVNDVLACYINTIIHFFDENYVKQIVQKHLELAPNLVESVLQLERDEEIKDEL
jgi:hypothetical protein